MIKLGNGIWIGTASATLTGTPVSAILNVAHDLHCSIGCNNGIEYMQVGLVDGPGNPTSAYYAAALALATLVKRHNDVMVCCHEGGRSMAVVMMYLQTRFARGWDFWSESLRERVDAELPVPNAAHHEAFDKMNWDLLKKLGE